MNILVTGGSGTIGGYVLRELLHWGHSVSCYSRTAPLVDGVRFLKGDVTSPEQLQEACRGHQAVVHLAAVPGPNRATIERLMAVNATGTIQVLEAARLNGIRKVVFASSAAALGFSFQKRGMVPQYFPVDEEHPSEPQDEYGLSKLLAELCCKSYSAAYGIQTICLRINHNWYLDREGARLAVQAGWAKGLTVEELWTDRYLRTIQDAEKGWPAPGPPSPRNNLWAVTDARDAAQAFRLAIENKDLLHEVFLINGDDTCSLVDTPMLLARHYPTVPIRKPLPGFASLISHEKATRMLGYKPRYTWRKSDFQVWMTSTLV